jgi:hypothetical protein
VTGAELLRSLRAEADRVAGIADDGQRACSLRATSSGKQRYGRVQAVDMLH